MVDNLPIDSDPLTGLYGMASSTSNFYNYRQYREIYPVASDQELLTHYMYGGAGPFIDLLIYVDLGVGWNLNPVDFDEDEGLEAVKLVDNEFQKRDVNASMMQFAAYYMVLGRACLIKTYNKNGDFYFDEKSRTSGLDCINPMTLTIGSIREVMEDNTGTKEFVQQYKGNTSSFSQDRVIYRANNPFNKHSVRGFSNLQRCISDLRLLGQFPGNRGKLARKYSNLHRIFKVKTAEFGVSERGKTILNDAEQSQRLLNELQSYYSNLEEKGSTFFMYDWVDVEESGYAGKEVDLTELERQTLRNIALMLDVPLDLLTYNQTVNRSVMEVLEDIFVNKQKAGARKYVYTPIIEGIANEFLLKHDICGGRLEVEFNPFLSKNLVEIASMLKDLWPTGCITSNEMRSKLDLPPLLKEDEKGMEDVE